MAVELTGNEILGVIVDGCLSVCLAVLEVHRMNWQLVQGYNPTFTLRQLE